jgi:hypothetical protein
MMQGDIKTKYMNQDLISNSFVDNLNRVAVKRNVVLSAICLGLYIVYTILHLLSWYFFIKKTDWELIDTPKLIFTFYISPAIEIITVFISIYGYFLIFRAYRFINSSCDKSDPMLMSKGFSFFYKANILSLILICISIILSVVNQFLSD